MMSTTIITETMKPDTKDDTESLKSPIENESETVEKSKKKKKKKSKKSAKQKEEEAQAILQAQEKAALAARVPVLQISRNKHWRYISSYHGPWLQLPVELLESLLVLNLDPATLTAPPEPRTLKQIGGKLPSIVGNGKSRDRSFSGMSEINSLPDFPALESSFQQLRIGKATPPPIDPGVFRSVTSIRRLIDEASELSVRASAGLSATSARHHRGGAASSVNNNPWAGPQNVNSQEPISGGRNLAMSAMRVHRLRALAVSKLAEAYKADEIASSVMVMQGGSVFDELAERVLKNDPNDQDAKYVHFFHEKIPSRQLSESTTTKVLDELIARNPIRLEYYRTRGIVHTFRDEFPQATKDFTYALKEARAARKAKTAHVNNSNGPTSNKKRKGSKNTQLGAEVPMEEDHVETPLHPSAMDDAPDPLESQLLFLRGSAYLQYAVFLIEEAIFKLEGVRKQSAPDGSELRLSMLEGSRYGGVETGNPDGPLGNKESPKRSFYKAAIGGKEFKEQITNLLKKSMRDHEKFLAHFDTIEGPNPGFSGDIASQTAYAFLLSEAMRPGNHAQDISITDPPSVFSTYHPLIVECHFSILLCLLMLMETHLPTLLKTFTRTAALIDGLEGYPVFLPPRSMAHAEFVEILERLAGGWRLGIQPHSLMSTLKAIDSSPAAPMEAAGGSSSSSAPPPIPSASGSSVPLDYPPTNNHMNGNDGHASDLHHSLDCLRILLAPVLTRQRKRQAEKASANGKAKKPPLSIPLHGPRVEIILAWLAANPLDAMERAVSP